MRIIKFRAWNKKAKRFLMDVQTMYDGLGKYFDNHGKEIDIYDDNDWYSSSFEVYLNDKNFVIQQYTGLKDKNGKEIYEGDIVMVRKAFNDYTQMNSEIYGGWKSVVEWKRLGFRLKEEDIYKADWSSLEVIGNIYENPELLNKCSI